MRFGWTAIPRHNRGNFLAAGAALIGIKPTDAIEGMLAAQMVATHNAALECYRRAMLGEQKDLSEWGGVENLNQANKLTRSYATLLEALNRIAARGSNESRSSTSTSIPAGRRSLAPSRGMG